MEIRSQQNSAERKGKKGRSGEGGGQKRKEERMGKMPKKIYVNRYS